MIGGEFEIDITKQREFVPQPNTYYYASGRAALYQILCSLKPSHKKIWMPDWLCHTMVEVAVKAGFEVLFYQLDNSFKASIEVLERQGFCDAEAVLMVNYFGLQDLTDSAKAIKDSFPNSVVIEDDVQAYWEFAEKDNPYADYRFTSLRKTFAVPDGGLVKTNRPMPVVSAANSFTQYKLDAGQMKLHRGEEGIQDEEYLALFEKGERKIDDNYNGCMSNESKRLFAGTDIDQVKRQRQANAAMLVKSLSELGIRTVLPVNTYSVPLFIPICLENRDEVRRRMFRHEVFCPVHWPLEGMNVKTGANMAAHELSLIVDQRYTEKDMNLIVTLLNK